MSTIFFLGKFISYYLYLFIFNVEAILIRPNDVYINLVKEVYDHSQARSLVLLYATPGLHQTPDMSTTTRLVRLQRAFNKFYVFVTITDIQTFVSQPEKNLKDLSKVLFVFLNDSDNVKKDISRHLIRSVRMSHQTWLIFFGEETKIDYFFEDIYIPINCDFMVSQINLMNQPEEIITEVYRIREGTELISNILTKWNPKDKFALRDTPISQSRNMQGHELRIGVKNQIPHMKVIRNGTNITDVKGISGEIMKSLKSTLNFTECFVDIDSMVSNPNDLIARDTRSLVDNKSDIHFSYLKFHEINIIDYSLSIDDYNNYVWIKQPSKAFAWNNFFVPFGIQIWIILGCFPIVFGIMLSIIMFINQWTLKNKTYAIKNPPNVGNYIFNVTRILFNQCQDDEESQPACIKIIYLTISATMVIIFAAYSAVLTSSLATNTSPHSLGTLEEFLKDGSWSLNVPKYAIHEVNFLRPVKDKKLQKIYDKIISKGLQSRPNNVTEGLAFVCQNNKYAFLASEYEAITFQYEDCTLYRTKIQVPLYLNFMLQRYSPFREMINIKILSLREYGITQRIMLDIKHLQEQNESLIDVEMIDVLPLLIFLAIGILLGAIKMCIERMLNGKMLQILVQRILQKILEKRIHNIENNFFKIRKNDVDYTWLYNTYHKKL